MLKAAGGRCRNGGLPDAVLRCTSTAVIRAHIMAYVRPVDAHPLRLMKWLEQNPSLEELQRRFPRDWEIVEDELAGAINDKDHGRLHALLKPLESFALPKAGRNARLSNQQTIELNGRLIRQRMSAIAIERFLKTSLAKEKKLHLPFLDRFLIRHLFFTRAYRRKLVSNRLFALLWPFVRRPNILLPLAESHGIYCFYSTGLVKEIAALIGDRHAVEIAAGDGALTRFLRRHGASVTASDDYSWSGKINYPAEVLNCDAHTVLRQENPEVVLCSWPPAKNRFEEHVFRTNSVQRYIVIGSEHRFAFGNWAVYRSQALFRLRKDDALSALLLPREFGGAVYVFDRIER